MPSKALSHHNKTINKANLFLSKIKRQATQVQDRNNSPSSEVTIQLFTFTILLRYTNLSFADLKITEFNSVASRWDKNYYLLLVVLHIMGNASKTTITKMYGLRPSNANKILLQLIKSGYIEQIEVSVSKSYQGSFKSNLEKHLRLTSKGFDKVSYITSLLVDDTLL